MGNYPAYWQILDPQKSLPIQGWIKRFKMQYVWKNAVNKGRRVGWWWIKKGRIGGGGEV